MTTVNFRIRTNTSIVDRYRHICGHRSHSPTTLTFHFQELLSLRLAL